MYPRGQTCFKLSNLLAMELLNSPSFGTPNEQFANSITATHVIIVAVTATMFSRRECPREADALALFHEVRSEGTLVSIPFASPTCPAGYRSQAGRDW